MASSNNDQREGNDNSVSLNLEAKSDLNCMTVTTQRLSYKGIGMIPEPEEQLSRILEQYKLPLMPAIFIG
jgi:hypothetical protein